MANLESEQGVSHPVTVSRRAVVKALGAIAVWPYLSDSAAEAFATIQTTKAPPQLAFLTAAQYASLDALTETIIPADDHAPGAREARVADYIDLLLSESDDRDPANVDGRPCRARRREPPPVQGALREADRRAGDRAAHRRSARNEPSPRRRSSSSSRTTKEATIRGYYTSEIGIHKELEYQGNKFLARVRRLHASRARLRAEEDKGDEHMQQPDRRSSSSPRRWKPRARPPPPSSRDRRSLRRHHRRIRRGRRHGRLSARHRGHQGAAARGRPHARSAGEYRTMEWPYASVRRGRLPADEFALGAAEYNMIDRPYGTAGRVREVPEAAVVLGQHVHAQLDGRREAEPDDRHALRMGAGTRARREDEPVGPRVAADVRLRLQGGEPRRLRRGLADLVRGHLAVLRQGGSRCSVSRARKRIFLSCPTASSSAASSSTAAR